MSVTLHVQVPRYVVKYIRAKYNLQPGEAWKIKQRGIEHTTLLSLLERKVDRYADPRKNEAVLDVYLSDRLYQRNGMHLSQDSVDKFCDFIKDRLLEEITLYSNGVRTGQGLKKIDKVVTVCAAGKLHEKAKIKRIPAKEGVRFFAQNESINDILEKYQITDADLRLDSVIKHVQRRVCAA